MEKIAWIAGMAVSGICTLAAAGLALFAEPAELAAMGVETGRREREAEKRVPDADRFMERHPGCAVYCGMLGGAEPDRHGVRSLNEYFDGAERDADAANIWLANSDRFCNRTAFFVSERVRSAVSLYGGGDVHPNA